MCLTQACMQNWINLDKIVRGNLVCTNFVSTLWRFGLVRSVWTNCRSRCKEIRAWNHEMGWLPRARRPDPDITTEPCPVPEPALCPFPSLPFPPFKWALRPYPSSLSATPRHATHRHTQSHVRPGLCLCERRSVPDPEHYSAPSFTAK